MATFFGQGPRHFKNPVHVAGSLSSSSSASYRRYPAKNLPRRFDSDQYVIVAQRLVENGNSLKIGAKGLMGRVDGDFPVRTRSVADLDDFRAYPLAAIEFLKKRQHRASHVHRAENGRTKQGRIATDTQRSQPICIREGFVDKPVVSVWFVYK